MVLANPFGLFDPCGNVQECCRQLSGPPELHTYRGGYEDRAWDTRSAERISNISIHCGNFASLCRLPKEQFLTSESICQLMARMSIDGSDVAPGDRKTVCDPCCGSGRMLLVAADIQSGLEFVGQDIALRCVRMTAISLALRNHYG